jgi:cytochrome P450
MSFIQFLTSNISLSQLLLFFCTTYLLYLLILRISEYRRIRNLGGRAAPVSKWVPYDLLFIYHGIKHALANKNYDFWHASFHRFGNPANPYTLEARPGGRRVVFTADPENIKAILATQFGDYGKGENFHEEWKEFLGDSIFATDGSLWHHSRQLIRPQFVKDRLSDLDIFEKYFQIMMPQLLGAGLQDGKLSGSEWDRGKTVDCCDIFFRYTLDVSTEFLLGRSVGSLTNPAVKFAEAFGTVQHIQVFSACSAPVTVLSLTQLQSVMTRLGPLLWLMPRHKLRANIRVINEFVNPYIEQTLRLSPAELEKVGKGDHGYTFLHALANYTRDRKVLRDQLVAILLAGRDTTACTLSWTMYELAKQPRIVQKLREEIERQVGLERRPSYDDLKSMKYLQVSISRSGNWTVTWLVIRMMY